MQSFHSYALYFDPLCINLKKTEIVSRITDSNPQAMNLTKMPFCKE